jgi:hypothetical protein
MCTYVKTVLLSTYTKSRSYGEKRGTSLLADAHLRSKTTLLFAQIWEREGERERGREREREREQQSKRIFARAITEEKKKRKEEGSHKKRGAQRRQLSILSCTLI